MASFLALLAFLQTAGVHVERVAVPGPSGVTLDAANTLSAPIAVAPRKGSSAAVADGRLTARLPPYSYQMIRLILA